MADSSFFLHPRLEWQRRYEALRACFVANSIAEAVRFSNRNALSSLILVKIHFDVLMTLIADTLYTLLDRKLRGFEDCVRCAQAVSSLRKMQRDDRGSRWSCDRDLSPSRPQSDPSLRTLAESPSLFASMR